MKCLSLWQPWATLLVTGKKCVETRGRGMLHTGPLLIHAAKKWDGALQGTCLTFPFREALAEFGVPGARHDWTQPDLDAKKAGWGMPFGAIIGRVDVVECVHTHSVILREKQGDTPGWFEGWHNGVLARYLVIGTREKVFGDYSPGRFAFLCKNPIRFAKPIPYRGMQSLFDVPDEVIKEAT